MDRRDRKACRVYKVLQGHKVKPDLRVREVGLGLKAQKVNKGCAANLGFRAKPAQRARMVKMANEALKDKMAKLAPKAQSAQPVAPDPRESAERKALQALQAEMASTASPGQRVKLAQLVLKAKRVRGVNGGLKVRLEPRERLELMANLVKEARRA